MVRVQLGSQEQYDVAAQTIGRAQPGRWLASLSRDELAVEIDHPALAKLIERVRAGAPVILPYPGRDRDSWLIAGADRRELDQTMERVSRFVLPSYVEWSPADTPRLLKQFDPALNDLQRAGALLFGAGYYTWQSPPTLFGRILDRLDLWMDLEARRPRIQSARLRTYHELHEQFSTAMTAGRWADAEQALQEMQQRNLIGADNLAFLQVQLLHHQQRWRAIWERADFETLARLRMPRPVRAALLTAFHQSVLLPPEQEGHFEEALAALQQTRPRLGRLLEGRFEIADAPVVRVFAYIAILNLDRAGLDVLTGLEADDQTRRLLQWARARLPVAPAGTEPGPDPLVRARTALGYDDLDGARRAALEIVEPKARALLLMEVAFNSGDTQYAEEALVAFRGLPQEQQQQLEATNRAVRHYLADLTQLTAPDGDPQLLPQRVLTIDEVLNRGPDTFDMDDCRGVAHLLERELRALIVRELSTLTQNWWKQRVHNDVRQRANEIRAQREHSGPRGLPHRHVSEYLDFSDYARVILTKNNWEEAFKRIFASQEEVSFLLNKLKMYRNDIAHNRTFYSRERNQFIVIAQALLEKLVPPGEDSGEETAGAP